MTKKEMIKKLQAREASDWENLQLYKRVFGKDHEHSNSALAQWGTSSDILEDLGIESIRFK